MKVKVVDIDLARDRFNYDPETGEITWKNSLRGGMNGKPAGSPGRKGRIRIVINKKGFYAHRIAWAIYYGENPSGEIDHKDGDPSNNRISNLHVVTRSENMQNHAGIRGIEVTPYGKFRAYVRINGVISGANFNTLEEAVQARIKMKMEKHTNIPRFIEAVEALAQSPSVGLNTKKEVE
jgi:hypothetical protein